MSFNLRSAFSLLGAVGIFICLLLFLYFPAVPKSFLGWAALIFVGLPIWFFLEWLGWVVLGSRFFSQLPRWARIVVAVPVVAALMVLAAFLGQFVQRLVLST